MPSEDTKTLEFNQYQRSDKTPSIFHVGKYRMKKFCESLRKQARKIILKRKKMKLLAKDLQKLYENAKFCYI